LYPLFVIETLGQHLGLTGLFIAGILSTIFSEVKGIIDDV
jgi:hypothetical protein